MRSVRTRHEKRCLADELVEGGMYRRARQIYSQLLRQTPDDPHLLALRGYTSYRIGDLVSAVVDFNDALALQDDAPNTLFLRAKCKELLNDLDAAIADYRRVLSLAPDTADAHAAIAMICEYRGDFPAARREHSEALRLDSGTVSSKRFFEKYGS